MCGRELEKFVCDVRISGARECAYTHINTIPCHSRNSAFRKSQCALVQNREMTRAHTHTQEHTHLVWHVSAAAHVHTHTYKRIPIPKIIDRQRSDMYAMRARVCVCVLSMFLWNGYQTENENGNHKIRQ